LLLASLSVQRLQLKLAGVPGCSPLPVTALPEVEARGQSLLLMICDESRLHLDLKTDEKGIMRGNRPTIAWFKDRADNILSVVKPG